MAPNLLIDRPLTESLIQPLQGEGETHLSHGTHKVISTYSKKDILTDSQPPVQQLIFRDTSHTVNSSLPEIEERSQNHTSWKNPESAIEERQQHHTNWRTEETLLEKRDNYGHSQEWSPANNPTMTLAKVGEGTKTGQTQSPQESSGKQLPRIDERTMMEVLMNHETNSEPIMERMVPNFPIPHFSPRGLATAAHGNNRGMNPTNLNYFSPGFPNYDLSSPMISNGRVYYPIIQGYVPLTNFRVNSPHVGLPLARELSYHFAVPLENNDNPHFQVGSDVSDLPKQIEERYPENHSFSTIHPPKKSRPTLLTPKPLNKTKLAKEGSLPKGDLSATFINDKKFDLSHFEEELADTSHLGQELADVSNLLHHQKSVEELSHPGENVEIREDWILSSEGTTAVILIGMCSVILMLICLIFVLKRFRKTGTQDKLEAAEKKAQERSNLWLDLYNPINLIPQISYLHTLPQIDLPNKTNCNKEGSSDQFMSRCEEPNASTVGRLWFAVRYDPDKFNLHVNIRHARYRNGREVSSNTGEVWVEGLILSSSLNEVKASNRTSSRRATQSPLFNHSFSFIMKEDEVESSILKLVLHDQLPKKEEEAVGSILLPLTFLDLNSNELLYRDFV